MDFVILFIFISNFFKTGSGSISFNEGDVVRRDPNVVNIEEFEGLQTGAVPPPSFYKDYHGCNHIAHCGETSEIIPTYGEYDGKIVPIYFLNSTSEDLASKGYKITDRKVGGSYVLKSFSYTKDGVTKSMAIDGPLAVSPSGGEPADVMRGYYTVLLGQKEENKITWLCDGTLITSQWVLSAAHCFTNSRAEPNIIRLGEYDIDTPTEKNNDYKGKFIYDYEIVDVVPHPHFKIDERYHDLVLLKMERPYPLFSHRIRPVCLPWGVLSNQNLVGRTVSLSGWGSTQYGGSKTHLLQQLDVEVFETSKCRRSYSTLRDYRTSYPHGIRDNDVLCVGSQEPGKDACGGDSGAPLTLKVKDGRIRYVVVGIVSRGYGCGLVNFPGLYMPINRHENLQWIKDVAFKECT